MANSKDKQKKVKHGKIKIKSDGTPEGIEITMNGILIPVVAYDSNLELLNLNLEHGSDAVVNISVYVSKVILKKNKKKRITNKEEAK